MRITMLLCALATLCACASAPEAPAGPPSLQIAPGLPAPPQARFYADCIAQAAQANTYDREANVLRFHCDGAVAQRFFEGLGPWSAEIGSALEGEGRTWRFSTVIEQNPSFADFCWREGDVFGCTVVLNVGEFLAR